MNLCPRESGPPDRVVCVHEGGHAAAMHAFGRRIEYAHADSVEGAVQPVKLSPDDEIDCVAHSVIMLSGDMAEGRDPLSRQEWIATILGQRPDATSDEQRAWHFARHLAGGNADVEDIMTQMDRIWNVAVDTFAAPGFWLAVCAVASILRRDGRLDGETVHTLCEQHLAFGSLAHLTKDQQ